MLLLILFFSVFSISKVQSVTHLTCSQDFCDNYLIEEGCPTLATKCLIQNATHNGQIFQSPTICNCCETCVEHILEGEHCSIGAPGLPIPSGMCGPGLYCSQLAGEDHSTCKKTMGTKCMEAQIKYDEKNAAGDLGHLMQRPQCDSNGNYNPVICIPGQICFCVDEEGNRIFGEAIESATAASTMNCGCSRMSTKLESVIKQTRPSMVARCLEDGSFDTIQCIGDRCMCVDTKNGEPTHSTIYNATNGLEEMPCFDRKQHNSLSYMTDCELRLMTEINRVKELELNGYEVVGALFNLCELDGRDKRIREDLNYRWCADRNGNQLAEKVLKNSTVAETLTCNCVNIRQIMDDNGEVELPSCCPNGEFEGIQCRRGLCYCVDENGVQQTKEVPYDLRNDLSCAISC